MLSVGHLGVNEDSMAKADSTKDAKEQLFEAERLAAYWLWLGNQASERGELEKAERHYARGQKWHDKVTILLGEN